MHSTHHKDMNTRCVYIHLQLFSNLVKPPRHEHHCMWSHPSQCMQSTHHQDRPPHVVTSISKYTINPPSRYKHHIWSHPLQGMLSTNHKIRSQNMQSTQHHDMNTRCGYIYHKLLLIQSTHHQHMSTTHDVTSIGQKNFKRKKVGFRFHGEKKGGQVRIFVVAVVIVECNITLNNQFMICRIYT